MEHFIITIGTLVASFILSGYVFYRGFGWGGNFSSSLAAALYLGGYGAVMGIYHVKWYITPSIGIDWHGYVIFLLGGCIYGGHCIVLFYRGNWKREK